MGTDFEKKAGKRLLCTAQTTVDCLLGRLDRLRDRGRPFWIAVGVLHGARLSGDPKLLLDCLRGRQPDLGTPQDHDDIDCARTLLSLYEAADEFAAAIGEAEECPTP